MENKLTIAHLAPYLPYGLKMRFENITGREITLTGIHGGDGFAARISDGRYGYWLDGCGFKPVLRPLSQLTQEIEHNGGRFVPYKKLGWESGDMLISCVKSKTKKDLPYRDAVKLFEWGFDVFSLIPQGLAIEKGSAS